MAFGAKGDGSSDDAAAINQALAAACKVAAAGTDATVLLPANHTYYALNIIALTGPCGTNRVTLEVTGKLVVDARSRGTSLKALVYLQNLNALSVLGGGTMDGMGATWWGLGQSSRPEVLLVSGCSAVEIGGITTINPPKVHITVQKSSHVWIHDVTTSAPSSSPNTDSIHISSCTDVLISQCSLSSGDDCVSIVGNSKDVVVDNLVCTAGHGYSIGSLGAGQAQACVSNVTVRNSVLSGTTNGLRIKTYQGGTGAVWNVRFENITLTTVQRPIILDQFYCDKGPCSVQKNAIALFNLSYSGIWGSTVDSSSSSGEGIVLQCSDSVPCMHLWFRDIAISSTSGKVLTPLINDAYGSAVGPISPGLAALPAGNPSTGLLAAVKAQAALCGVTSL